MGVFSLDITHCLDKDVCVCEIIETGTLCLHIDWIDTYSAQPSDKAGFYLKM
jgi:hypothetical protein